MALAPTVQLRDGARMPLLGLGTWPLNDGEAGLIPYPSHSARS